MLKKLCLLQSQEDILLCYHLGGFLFYLYNLYGDKLYEWNELGVMIHFYMGIQLVQYHMNACRILIVPVPVIKKNPPKIQPYPPLIESLLHLY